MNNTERIEDNLHEAMVCFESAIRETNMAMTDFGKAVAVTKQNFSICQKISWWIQGLWELMEEFLNTSDMSEIKVDYFLNGCALLEQAEVAERQTL